MALNQSLAITNDDMPNKAPELEALYNDLDAFICELAEDGTIESPPDARSSSESDSNTTAAHSVEPSNRDPLRPPAAAAAINTDDDEGQNEGLDYSTLLDIYNRPVSQQIGNDSSDIPTSRSVSVSSTKTTPPGNVRRTHPLFPKNKIDNTLSPPASPSFFGIGRPLAPKEASGSPSFFMPRSSSLSNQQQHQHASLPNSPGPAGSRSPNATRSNQPSLYDVAMSTGTSGAAVSILSFPEYSRLSELANKFILEVGLLNDRRRMFCTVEYPLSFTGEEAVEIIESLLPAGVPERTGLCVARAFMRTAPALVGPISYSEKSLKRNTLYQSANEVYTLIDETIDSGVLPQGVITPLTRCYTQSCFPGQGGCYAPLCPNRTAALDDDDDDDDDEPLDKLGRQASLKSMTSSHDTNFSSRSWTAAMPREILLKTPDAEIKRQEAIHEIIYTEEDYVRDLVLLDELFATPLRTAQCLDEERREEFCNYVFNNYKDLLDIHRDLCRDLQDRQSEAASAAGNGVGFVEGVGDIFEVHLPRFMAAYERYGPHVILAEYSAKNEAQKSILFQNFIRDTEKQAECRKLPFRHFLILPVTRLQRYPLLMSAILKKTPDDHPDKACLSACCDRLREIASSMDEKTVETKNVLRLIQINDAIRYKPGEENAYHMLQLLHPERRLLHEGPMTRRSQTGVETIDLHIFLFDHLLLMTKTKKPSSSSDQVEYHISKRPVPLELLQVQDATEGFALGLRQITTSLASPKGTGPLQSMASPTGGLVLSTGTGQNQLLIHHLGKNGGDHLLYAKTVDIRRTWKEKIVAAKAAFESAHPENQVFEIRSLSDTTFTGSNAHGQALNHGKVTCSIPFEGFNGIRMLAVGTNVGVWMGMEGDTASMRQVLALADIHQIAVLETEHILILLADKTLYAYALQGLDPTAAGSLPNRPCQKIAQHISYFEAGFCNNRTLVIAMKKRGMDSHFRALEPTCGDLRDPKNVKFVTTKSGLFGTKSPPAWFQTYKEFYIGADSFAIHLLKARVAVVCTRGFEIIDLDHLTMNRNLPDLSHPDFGPLSQRDDVRPLAMFRCGPMQYLLCYNAFAFLVDSHGTLIQGSWIEWEGTPQSVAFCPPYVVAFDPRFIEVRHAESGRLIQILAGDHMRMLQFATSAGIPTPLIHGCMSHPFKTGYQYVFQLTATFEPTF